MALSTLPIVTSEAGQKISAIPTIAVDAAGNISSGGASPATYYLAGTAGSPLASLAAAATTAPVVIPAGQSASYGWNVTMGGTNPSLVLEALNADTTTYSTVATVTASGSIGVVIFTGGGGATVRLRNAGANPITGLISALMN